MSLFSDLERDEGVRMEPYKDSVGIWTIGVGHNLEQGLDADVLRIMAAKGLIKFDDETCRLQLAKDVERATIACKSLFGCWDRLIQSRRDVLLNMAFNLGFNRLAKFHNMISAVEAGDYVKAADEMLLSKWAKQVGHRATRLAHIMRGDDS